MPIYKRVSGNLVVTAVNSGDSITLESSFAQISGNLSVSANSNLANTTIANLTVTENAVIDGNLTVVGNLTATGNIAGDRIFNGTTSIEIPAPGSNAVISVGGVSNVAAFTPAGMIVTGTVGVSGNITSSANISASGLVSSGNVTGAYFVGDGQFLTNVIANVGGASILNNGSSNVNIPVTNGPVTVGVQGISNVVVISTTAVDIAPDLYADNIFTNIISSDDSTAVVLDDDVSITQDLQVTGNIISDAISAASISAPSVTATTVSATSVSAASVTATDVYAGNVAANILRSDDSTAITLDDDVTVTQNLQVTGNVSGDYILGNGALLTGVITSVANINNGTTSVEIGVPDGNVAVTVNGVANVLVIDTTGANLTGTLEASGNITGSYILGNGSQLTGIDATSIQNGTANVRTILNGNVTISAAGSANVVVVTATGANITGTFDATGNANVGNLGTAGVISAVGNITGGNITTLGLVNATGNVTGNNFNLSGNLVDAGALSIITSSSGNITLAPDGSGVVVINTDLRNGQANGVGNIGSASGYFNTVFAKATSAQYADLAEMYLADAVYPAGTVVRFGGTREITICNTANSASVAGVVSSNPAVLLNSGITVPAGAVATKLALIGRVPCYVRGPVAKGDILISDTAGFAAVDNDAAAGRIIGKALGSSSVDALIEVVVGIGS